MDYAQKILVLQVLPHPGGGGGVRSAAWSSDGELVALAADDAVVVQHFDSQASFRATITQEVRSGVSVNLMALRVIHWCSASHRCAARPAGLTQADRAAAHAATSWLQLKQAGPAMVLS